MSDEERRQRTFTHPPTEEEIAELNRLLDSGEAMTIEGRMLEVAHYVTGIDAMEGEYEDDSEKGPVGEDRGVVSGRGPGEGGSDHRDGAGAGTEAGERHRELPHRLDDYDRVAARPKKHPSRRELEQAMNRFRAAVGDSGLELDHYAASGGYRIVKLNPTGGEETPFGSRRRKAAEMLAMLDFAVDALHWYLRGRHGE
jgi:hypothetical protein